MLLKGDAFEYLDKQLVPDGTADFIIWDPPYGIGDSKLTHKDKKWKKSSESWDTFDSLDDQYAFYLKFANKLGTLLKPTGSIITFGSFHNIYMLGEIWQRQMKWKVINSIVWNKINAMFNVTCSSLIESCEHMIWSSPSKKFYFDYERSKDIAGGTQLRNVWSSEITPAKERVGHPHAKPLWLYSRLLDIACPKDGLVLDPMCGSGTTGVVCEARGLNYICIEKNDAYYAMAEKRIKEASRAATAERNMFG
jgi:site-specific DNA-methyltransferase (adenine-specific)